MIPFKSVQFFAWISGESNLKPKVSKTLSTISIAHLMFSSLNVLFRNIRSETMKKKLDENYNEICAIYVCSWNNHEDTELL